MKTAILGKDGFVFEECKTPECKSNQVLVKSAWLLSCDDKPYYVIAIILISLLTKK